MIRVARGGSPALHDRREEGWGYAPKRARPGRLGLDGQGPQAPQLKEERCQPFTAGHRCARDGSRLAETTGSVHDSPAPQGGAPQIASEQDGMSSAESLRYRGAASLKPKK